MTKSVFCKLKEVISKVERLNNEEQKRIAKMPDEEIKWDTTLQNSSKLFCKFVQEASMNIKSGKTKKMTGN